MRAFLRVNDLRTCVRRIDFQHPGKSLHVLSSTDAQQDLIVFQKEKNSPRGSNTGVEISGRRTLDPPLPTFVLSAGLISADIFSIAPALDAASGRRSYSCLTENIFGSSLFQTTLSAPKLELSQERCQASDSKHSDPRFSSSHVGTRILDV